MAFRLRNKEVAVPLSLPHFGVQKTPGELRLQLRLHVVLFCVLALGFLGYWLLNYYVFPLFDPIFIWAREVSAATGGLSLVAIALVATWKPSVFKGLPIISTTLFGVLAGSLLMVCGFYLGSPPLLLIGAWLSTFISGVVSVITGIACTQMNLRGAGISIAAAYLVAYALRWAFLALPSEIGLLAYIVEPLAALGLLAGYARPLFTRIFTAEPPAQAAVTRPASFLPFGNKVFICLILFRFVYGYMLTFGETERVPLLTAATLVPLMALLIIIMLKRGQLNPDRLFPAAVLCIVAGFLALPLEGLQGGSTLIVSTLLSTGVGFFEVLLLFVFVALGSRNRAISLVVFSWAYALNSLGTLVGANFGRFTNQYFDSNPLAIAALAAGVILSFVAYILIALKDFSFRRTIENIESGEPSAPAVTPGEQDDGSRLRRKCDSLSRQYELTAREHEVLALLARGRNSKVIQEELHITYNTAKAHVRHIYTKLGVHTQQELIDLAEEPEN
jgi:DNA-binding CsgD family transcriptional regulator/F0F1-type ATP synthase assembly protein I